MLETGWHGLCIVHYNVSMLTVERLQSGLPIRGLGIPLRLFESVGSTNDEAKILADQGSPHGTLVVADAQTRGRGRQDRTWYSAPGSGLAMSLILRPDHMLAGISTLTALGALAVTESLSSRGVEAHIKWPNDVLVGSGKLAGVLVEMSWSGEAIEYAILGIGVNVRPGSIPPVDLDTPATCVDHVVGEQVSRFELLFQILESLGKWYEHIGEATLLKAWEDRLAFAGQSVILSSGAKRFEGRIEGLELDGRLRLQMDSGERILFNAGELSLRAIDTGDV